MKRKQQSRKNRIYYIPGMCEPIPCNELRCSFFLYLQGHLLLICIIKMCTKKHKHKEVLAFPGISSGWDRAHPACYIDCREVGVRSWVDDGSILSMGSGRVRETATWPQRDKIQPWPCSEEPTVHILHSLLDQPHTWIFPEPSPRWMAPQLQVLEGEMHTATEPPLPLHA